MAHALDIQGLVKEYKAGQPVLKGISLSIEGTGLTSVIGPSGTGKSTLLRCVNRLIDPTKGSIWLTHEGVRVDMSTLQGKALREQRRHIGMVFQEYNLVERLSVMENLLCGRLGYVSALRAWLRRFAPADIERAFQLLDQVGLAEQVHQRADALSGGQRQRVGIARALMQQPSLLLADEPTGALDSKTTVEILDLFDELHAQGLTLVVVTHEHSVAERAARVITVSDGAVISDVQTNSARQEALQ